MSQLEKAAAGVETEGKRLQRCVKAALEWRQVGAGKGASASQAASLEVRWPGWIGVNPFQVLEDDEEAEAQEEATGGGPTAEQGTREAAGKEVLRLEAATGVQKAAAKSLKEMSSEAREMAVAAARQLAEAIRGTGTSNEELVLREGHLRWQMMAAECGRQVMEASEAASALEAALDNAREVRRKAGEETAAPAG